MVTIKQGELNITYVWNEFKDIFGEPKVKPKKFKSQFVVLPKNMLDREILETYKPEEITLEELAYLLESKESSLTNGYANIFYIRDKDNILWAVSADWDAGRGGWDISADSVDLPRRWSAGDQVVSRNLTLRSSNTLSLESAIDLVKKEGYVIYKPL